VVRMTALAVAVGVVLGLGLWTLVALVPRVGAPRLSTRIAPYVADVSPEARALVDRRASEPAALVTGLAAPAIDRIRSLVAALLGGNAGVERRLRQAGSATTVAQFRSRQLLAAIGGVGIGIVAAALAVHAGTISPVIAVVIVVVAGAIGLLAPEQLLARAARARQARIAAELPTVLEFLALSLSAGEAVLDAVRRVARASTGELARELARVASDVNAGTPLAGALTRCASTLGLPALTRAFDQLVGALDRGTPLVDVFRAQAQDSREEAKRRLLEAAGRKEVAMLVPLVFLILPVTIVFAILPGIVVLQLGT
jgi:tight adherence protein C